MSQTCTVDGVKLPKRSELQRKHEAIKELRERPMTNEEINRQVAARKNSNKQAQRNATITRISQLMASKDLAVRRNDQPAVLDLESRIKAEGGDPVTGRLLDDTTGRDEDEDRIARINEMNRKRTKESMAAAHLAGIARKKHEDAIVQARMWVPSLECFLCPHSV